MLLLHPYWKIKSKTYDQWQYDSLLKDNIEKQQLKTNETLLKLIEFRKAARNKIGIQVSIGFIIFVKSLENIMKKILVHQ